VPERTRDTEKIASDSQKLDDAAFRQRKIAAQDQDLGSRSILEGEDKLIWYPAEVNTSIRPGWFYHKEEDDQVKPLSALIDIYEKSVGGNATFLLNIPPDQTGLFHENDVKRLRELGDYIRTTYADNLVEAAEIEAASEADIEPEHSAEHIRTDSYEEFFKTKDGISSCEITLTWQQAVKISHLVLKENILMSQRIEKFEIQAEEEGTFHTVYEGTVVGYKKIVSIAPVETRRIHIRILEARVASTLSFVGAYR
jgi:alpha-L-fucosidase